MHLTFKITEKKLEMEREVERQKNNFKDFADEQAHKIKQHHIQIAKLIEDNRLKTKYRDIEHFKAKMT